MNQEYARNVRRASPGDLAVTGPAKLNFKTCREVSGLLCRFHRAFSTELGPGQLSLLAQNRIMPL